MDDLLLVEEDVNILTSLMKNLHSSFQSAGFVLHKCKTNSASLADSMNWQFERMTKVLGVSWNTQLDVLSLFIPEISPITTKRTLLSRTMTIYDSVGWLDPFSLAFRALLRECRNAGWDDALPPDLQSRANRVYENFYNTFSDFEIPRYAPKGEIHIFCNAQRPLASVTENI